MTRLAALERRLLGQGLPAPPAALVGRILAAAASHGGPAAIIWSDRLWYSRAARLGWAAAVLLLLAAELALAPGSAGPTRSEEREARSHAAELAADLNLDPSWNARLAATRLDAGSGPEIAELDAAVDIL